ncbi:hypothetical protein AAK943_12640 [Emergencia timonensis]|uniref:hypothetical protein n=1 Tax=Emergencia timonensis TaxID=1776384 RepID=UPI000831F923|nr:hypothetical protein [Emergencia timonensis]
MARLFVFADRPAAAATVILYFWGKNALPCTRFPSQMPVDLSWIYAAELSLCREIKNMAKAQNNREDHMPSYGLTEIR